MPSALAGAIDEVRQRMPERFAGPAQWREAVGCAHCQHSGYKGRLGIYEMFDVGPQVQAAIMERASSHVLTALARSQGFRTLREDGLIKAWQGLTSLDEVLRVTGAGEPYGEGL